MDIAINLGGAAALAEVVFEALPGRTLDDQTRASIAARLSGVTLSGLHVHTRSLAPDPLDNSAVYVAVDAVETGKTTPALLRLALSSRAGDRFRGRVLIGRLRTTKGREVIVDAVPFGPADYDNIAAFVELVDSGLSPRPQGANPALVVSGGSGDTLALAFEAYRTVLRRTGWNAAAIACPGSPATPSGADRREEAVWAAVRAGWREGYGVETHHVLSNDGGGSEDLIRHAAAFTKFRIDTSRLLDYRADHRTKHGWSEPDVERLYEESIAPELRRWIETEYSRPFDMGSVSHTFAPHEIRRIALKFAPGLLLLERFHEAIQSAKERTPFDCEPSFLHAQTVTRAKELSFCLHWFKARGRPVQSVVPNLAFEAGRPYPETTEQQLEYLYGKGWDEIAEYTGVVYPGRPLDELEHRIRELATVARYFGANLTVEAAGGKQPAVFQLIGRATGGRVNVAVSADEIVDVAASLRS
jgi:hypothetical protein